MKLQPIRGTRDLISTECKAFRRVESRAASLAQLYGFEEIETPILEPAALFNRSLGDASDIVSKQMYQFLDRGGDEIVLRPEGTAGVARAFISEGLAQNLPLKLFYRGPMFRYERPQKGRYRQFYQFGVELLGVEKPVADIEVIAMGYQVLRNLNLEGDITLLINTIGDQASREAYREKLVSYLGTRKSELSQDSLVRLEVNPLRILDSKDEGDRKVIEGAPVLSESLTGEAKKFFAEVLAGLELLGIPFQVDQKLVRGLDYYCHTVFEFVSNSIGAQSAVLSGGRYDGLIRDLGGPVTPGVGWAMGVDRLTLLLKPEIEATFKVAIVPLGDEAELKAIQITQYLREHGIECDLGYSGNMAKRMKRADKIGAQVAVIFGLNEMQASKLQIKNLKTGEQVEIASADLLEVLRGHRI